MITIQERRSAETRVRILEKAGELFAAKGFDNVTMREIAKAAGCSHTTIYIYFADKMTLLGEWSMPLFQELLSDFLGVIDDEQTQRYGLLETSKRFVRFCLMNRSLVPLLFVAMSSRFDGPDSDEPLHHVRQSLFEQLTMRLLNQYGSLLSKKNLLRLTRIYFYMLQGIVSTYLHSDEPLDEQMERLDGTFQDAFQVVLDGFSQKLIRDV